MSYTVFDCETAGLDVLNDKLLGIGLYEKGHYKFIRYLPHHIEALQMIFGDKDMLYVAQNSKFDLQVLRTHNIEVKGKIADTQLMAWVLDENRKHGLKHLAKQEFGEEMMTYNEYKKLDRKLDKMSSKQTDLFRQEINAKRYELLKNYCLKDVEVTNRLFSLYYPQVKDNSFYKTEIELIQVLMDMEREGIKVNAEYLSKLKDQYEIKLGKIQGNFDRLVGRSINMNSPKQLREYFINELQMNIIKKSKKTGEASVDEEVLRKYAKQGVPETQLLLGHRKAQKLYSTYIVPLLDKSDENDRIHTSFRSTGAVTGRFSSEKPNLQNIPVKEGDLIRKAFIPDNGKVFLVADYNQIELRLLAHISQDKEMLEAYHKGDDLHQKTANILNVDRSVGKMLNFAIIYGLSARGLSKELNVLIIKAQEFITNYFNHYKGIKKYKEDILASCRKNQYVETIIGRKRRLPDINTPRHALRSYVEREAVNAPITGSAADIVKLAMLKLHKILPKECKMLLQVHDELIFECSQNMNVHSLANIIKETMENVVTLTVPLEVNIKVCQNWGEKS